MLKLIVSRAEPTPDHSSQSHIANVSFTAEICPKGPNLYLMTFEDPSHGLGCDFMLEVEENRYGLKERAVVCHYPKIAGEQLNVCVDEDDILYRVIMFQFQLKILGEFFAFCVDHHASKLIIYTDDAKADELRIYHDFLIRSNQMLTYSDEPMEMVMLLNQQTVENWKVFMDEMTVKFRQVLWQNQSTNSTIRQYLKAHPLG